MAIDQTQESDLPQNRLMVPHDLPVKSSIPHADQYIGVWSILEAHANALLAQAQQINIQLHLEQNGTPERQAAIAAQAATELNITRDGIAVVEINGSLTKHASSYASGRSTVAARRQIRAAARDESVLGILLHIDSPGGMVAGTVDLADEINEAKQKKPLYAYIEDLGASAAYWIASQADKVYANRSAEVGSIGVFMVVTDWSAYAAKEGAKVHVVRFGQYKGAGVAGTEITAEQLATWQKSVDDYGAMFVDAVASGRRMSKTAAKQLADGRVHSAADAVDLKLIDGVQTLDATMAALVAAGSRNQKRSKAMENEAVVTMAQLKKAIPGSTAEFREAQVEAGATLPDAIGAWAEHLQEENARLAAEKDAADKRAEEAESKAEKAKAQPTGGQVRGNKLAAKDNEGAADNGGRLDYYQMARDYQQKHKCRWSEACLEIKHRHPEAREVFGAPKKAAE